MRILVLQRNPITLMQLLENTDLELDFEDYRTWIVQLGVLYSQLSLLDRRFYYCLPYESLDTLQSSPIRKEQLQSFLQPKTITKYVMEEMLMQMKHSSKNKIKANLKRPVSSIYNGSKNADSSRNYLTMQLNARMSLITDICNKA